MGVMLKGLSGQRYQIEAKAFSSGGEGDIFGIVGVSDKVIKIYHSDRISAELEEKLKTMVQRPPSTGVLSQVAWPLDTVYDNAGKFCGFVMPRLSITAELSEIYTYPPRTNITYKQKLILAQNICVVISEVHKAGYVFGDFNPRNIGINTNTGTVAFLDTDSYHITDGRKTFRCKVCLDGYVAPELLKKCEAYKKDAYAIAPLPTFTKETDNFALAIHIFKLLMNGFTPFNGIKETERASTASPGVGNQAIKRDEYCFKPGNKPLSPAVPMLEALPVEIADLFTRAFMYGKVDPRERPSAVEWYKALSNYESSLIQCHREKTHLYKRELNVCPWCEADERYKIATAPQLRQKGFSTPVQPTMPVSSGLASSGTIVPPQQYGGAATAGYNRTVAAPLSPPPSSATKGPPRAKIDQWKKTVQTLYTTSWVVFILYTIFQVYLFFFANNFNVSLGLTALGYLVVIAFWGFMGGLNNYGMAAPLIPSLILFGSDAAGVGAIVMGKLYGSTLNLDGFDIFLLDVLGRSDFFVIKLMGVSLLVCSAAVLIPGLIGKHIREKIINP